MTDNTKRKLVILFIIVYWLFPEFFPGPIDDFIITVVGIMYNNKYLTE